MDAHQNNVGFTNFRFPGQVAKYVGKVRDSYVLENGLLIIVTTDRISAFDVVLQGLIPYKGEVLNNISAYFLKNTEHVVKNWLLACPHPNVSIGFYCRPYPIEIVVRGYLSGSSWRSYRDGNRKLGPLTLEDGMHENQKLPETVITPSTKSVTGHDVDISKEEILAEGIVGAERYTEIEQAALKLFEFGQTKALEKGLQLTDTKYEFGEKDGALYLIDEVHTPDSSRYFYREDLRATKEEGLNSKAYKLSKEYLRKWLLARYKSEDLARIPLPSELIQEISENYRELYRTLLNTEVGPSRSKKIDEIYATTSAFLEKCKYV